MPFSPVVSTKKGGTANGNTSDAVDTTGAKIITITIGWYGGAGGTPTISDSKGNTWTPRAQQPTLATSDFLTQTFDCINPTVGSGHTFTVSGTGIYTGIIASAWTVDSGYTIAFDAENKAGSNSAASQATGNIASGVANRLLISSLNYGDNADTPTIDGGFTVLQNLAANGGSNQGICQGYLIQTLAAAANPTWTRSGAAGPVQTTIAAYKATAATSAAVTGTGGSGMSSAEVRAGGKTLILTLTGDTFVAAGAAFDAVRQAIIDGIVSAGSATWGWNNVRSAIAVTAVGRTSGTVVTITLPAIAGYQVDANEVLTITIPASAVALAAAIVASPTVTISKTATDLTPVDDYDMTGTATRVRP